MAAYGLYSHIQSNRRRSIALLAGLFFLVYVLVYAGALTAEALSVPADVDTLLQLAFAETIKAAPFATIGTALWIVIAYYFHQSMIDALTGGREVQRTEEPRLYNILENLCVSRGITMPKLKVMESDQLNAFATGMNAKQYSITVTTGLLNRLNDAEIEVGPRSRAYACPQRRRAHDGHRGDHCRRRLVFRRIGVPALVLQRLQFSWFARRSPRRRCGRCHSDRRRPARAGLFPFVRHSARAIATARIPRRRRLGGTNQESRCHDLGAAQDRRPRRIAGRDLGGDGNVHRQPARRISANCSTPIRASTAGSRRWSISPAVTIPVRWRCRRKRANRTASPAPTMRRRTGRGVRSKPAISRHSHGERPQRPKTPRPVHHRKVRPDRGARTRAIIGRNSRVAINHIALKMPRRQRVCAVARHLEASKQSPVCVRVC